jgi:hypothetical protein
VLSQPGRQIIGAADQAELAQCHSNGLCRAAAGFSFRQQLLAEAGVAQMIGGEIDQGHDFLAIEMGKPLPKDKENGLDQIGAWLQDPLGGISDVKLGQHRQREQADQRIKSRLLWTRLAVDLAQRFYGITVSSGR